MSHKWLAFYGLLIITVSFLHVVYRGRAYRTTQNSINLMHHRDATTMALFYIPLGIVLIEMSVQLRPPESVASALLWVHLPLAVAFLVLLLVLRFWLTGLHSRHHGRLGRLCAALFAGTLGTGSVLIWQM